MRWGGQVLGIKTVSGFANDVVQTAKQTTDWAAERAQAAVVKAEAAATHVTEVAKSAIQYAAVHNPLPALAGRGQAAV